MKNIFYYVSGLIILSLNKLRYSLQGYKSPRPFPTSHVEHALSYDKTIISGFSNQLKAYTGSSQPFTAKTILELGPGGDIGVAGILIDEGAKAYFALDKFDLWSLMPEEFYEQLRKKLHSERARKEILNFKKGQNSDIHYLADSSLNVEPLPRSIDLIISQAALEHFDNPQKVINELSRKVQPGCVLCAEIDLQTHTRWIRESDPNNIYRYPDWLYKLLHFPGIPNRLRSADYQEILAENGWKNIRIIPLRKISEEQKHTTSGLASKFKNSEDLDTLSIMVLATLK